MALHCFLLCTAKQPGDFNISHSPDETFPEKHTNSKGLKHIFPEMLRWGKQLGNVTLNSPFSATNKTHWKQLCPSWGSFRPPVTGCSDLPSPGDSLWSLQCATLRGYAVLWMPASSLGLIQLAGGRERRWAGCQVFFQHRFRKKILKVPRAQIFSSSLSRLCYIATMPARRRDPPVVILFQWHTALTLQESPSSTYLLSEIITQTKPPMVGGCAGLIHFFFFFKLNKTCEKGFNNVLAARARGDSPPVTICAKIIKSTWALIEYVRNAL